VAFHPSAASLGNKFSRDLSREVASSSGSRKRSRDVDADDSKDGDIDQATALLKEKSEGTMSTLEDEINALKTELEEYASLPLAERAQWKEVITATRAT
jgi:hypothetical protein